MKNKILLTLTVWMACVAARSQVTVTGPSCVVTGLGYQYLINITDTAGAGIHICLSGGVFTGTADSCLNDSLVPAIYVTWNTGVTTAVISITSPAGSATDTIFVTNPLQGGSIDTAYLVKTINYNDTISLLPCSAAGGGNCSPSYSYQWQQSPDKVNWTDIPGATNLNMDVSLALTQTTFFKRKVTETASTSEGYSTIAVVYVTPATVAAGFYGNVYATSIALVAPAKQNRLPVNKQHHTPSPLNAL